MKKLKPRPTKRKNGWYLERSTIERIEHHGVLYDLLLPHAAWFLEGGVDIEAIRRNDPEIVDRIVEHLAAKSTSLPESFEEAVCLIGALATEAAAERIRERAQHRGYDLGEFKGRGSAVALSAFVFVQRREFFNEMHELVTTSSIRAFAEFHCKVAAPPLPPDLKERFEAELASYFDERAFTSWVCVRVVEAGDEYRIHVEHGRSLESLATLDPPGKPSRHALQPRVEDLLVYNPEKKALRVRACSPRERSDLRERFGRVLCGSEEAFDPKDTVYVLEPLRDVGVSSLVVHDVPGLEAVTLTKVTLKRDGALRRVDRHAATDLFAAMSDGDIDIRRGSIEDAELTFRFKGRVYPVRVLIRPSSNIVEYDRRRYGREVQAFLRQRGFCLDPNPEG